MLEAAKFGDPVLGIDIHMVLVPAPPAPAPIPTPLPHPFVGVVFDPIGAAIGAALGLAFGGGGPVLVNMMPCGNTGTEVKGVPHFPTPPGVSFAPNDIPSNDGTLIFGSQTVNFAGSSIARLTDMVMTCNFPINLPTSVCMAVPMGAPVLVGGPPAMNWLAAVTKAIRTKWFSDTLHKLTGAAKGSRLSKVICFLTGHPVDVMTGEVIADAVDFTLPGPITLRFERNYYSRCRREGPLGAAWHHPLDAAVEVSDHRVTVRLADGRERWHDPIAVGESSWDAVERFTLTRTATGYVTTDAAGLRRQFEPVTGDVARHALVRISDRAGHALTLRHDGDGRLARVVDSAGRHLRFEHDARGRLLAVRVRRGPRDDAAWDDLARYAYDDEGRLAAAIDPRGQRRSYAYRRGVLVRETNRNGLSFHFEYDWDDPDGWCVRTWGDGGIYDHKILYDKHRHTTVVEDSLGGRTQYYGDASGLVLRTVDALGGEHRYTWSEDCQKLAEVDPVGARTTWAYDARGNRTLQRDAFGAETRWAYDDRDLPVEMTDAAGQVWRRAYDDLGRMIESVDPLGARYRYHYDDAGEVSAVEDPIGRVRRWSRDGRGGVDETDWEGHTARRVYDDLGRLVEARDPLGAVTAVAWDACGRPAALTRPDGSVKRMEYDGEGNLTRVVDADERVTRFAYAGLNKLVERVDPAGAVVRCEYDAEENLVAVVNERGERHRFARDLEGRVVRETGFDGRERSTRYDPAGRAVEVRDHRGRATKIERDLAGRVTRRTYPDRRASRFAYDVEGRLAEAVSDDGAVRFARDAWGRVVREETDGFVVERRYDAVGNAVSRATSLGHEVAWHRDGNGRLAGVTLGRDPAWMRFDPASLAVAAPLRAPWTMEIDRDARGVETERRMPGAVVSQWRHDAVGRPVEHRVARRGDEMLTRGYQWRGADQLAAMIDAAEGPTRYEHDPRGNLVAARGAHGAQHRAVDEVGNVFRDPLRGDRVYGAGGVLERSSEARHVHDVEGRLVERVTPDGARWRYTWDAQHQLRAVTRPDGVEVTYGYDALGRRVRKTVDGQSTRWVWDGESLVHELPDGRDAVTWVTEPGRFSPLAKLEGAQRYGVVSDFQGAPTALFDESGELAWRGRLDVYGAAETSVARTACPWRWPGQYADDETGLSYNRFRYYDPAAGRYISQDPIGLRGGLRAYAYTHDPLTWIDPLGLAKKSCGLSGDALEDEVEKALTDAGVAIEKRAQDVIDPLTNRVLTDIDIEVEKAIIEVTSKRSGKLGQIEERVTNALINPNGKMVVLYAPNYLGVAGRAVEDAGGVVVRDLPSLIALVK